VTPAGWLHSQHALTVLGASSCARLAGIRTRFAGSISCRDDQINSPTLRLSYLFGDPCGVRTRDFLDENQMSWTTRRRGHGHCNPLTDTVSFKHQLIYNTVAYLLDIVYAVQDCLSACTGGGCATCFVVLPDRGIIELIRVHCKPTDRAHKYDPKSRGPMRKGAFLDTGLISYAAKLFELRLTPYL
jgi:hypothetical protein